MRASTSGTISVMEPYIPHVIPAKAGIQPSITQMLWIVVWMPTYVGMTESA
jgi:hypothetical protein